MKVVIFIPDAIFHEARRLAKRLGKSRNKLYSEAVADYLAKHRYDGVTDALNAIYSKESSSLDPELKAMMFASLNREEW